MPIEHTQDEETGSIVGHFYGYKGVDTNTSRVMLVRDKLPDMSNMDVDGGNPSTMAGTALHDTSQIAADNVPFQWLARHTPSSGTAVTLTGRQDGEVESWNGSAFTQLRLGLSTSNIWSAHAQVGDYTIVCDTTV